MKSLKYISIFALFLIFAFATGSAMAGKGGPKVDDDDICDDSRREANAFTLADIGDPENDPTIWLRMPGHIGDIDELCVELCEKVKRGDDICIFFETDFDDCGVDAPGWFVADDFGCQGGMGCGGEDDKFPGMTGSFQVTVFDSDCADPDIGVLGGDSFRVKD